MSAEKFHRKLPSALSSLQGFQHCEMEREDETLQMNVPAVNSIVSALSLPHFLGGADST
jgi:hypothetical protein